MAGTIRRPSLTGAGIFLVGGVAAIVWGVHTLLTRTLAQLAVMTDSKGQPLMHLRTGADTAVMVGVAAVAFAVWMVVRCLRWGNRPHPG